MQRPFLILIFFYFILPRVGAQEQEQAPVYIPAPGQPKNIILMIGDGMGVSQISAGMISSNDTLNLERFPFSGLIKTWNAKGAAPMPTNAAAALATGQHIDNGYIGMGSDGKQLKNIMEWAKEKKMAMGMVVTSSITHPSAASFIAHISDWNDQETIAAQYLQMEMDVIIGGGLRYFQNRIDNRNLLQEFEDKGYTIEDKLKKVGKISGDRIIALVAENGLYDSEQRKDYLPRATENAMQMLFEKSGAGFFLLVEGSQIGWAGKGNDLDYLTGEVIDFDKTIGKVLDYHGKSKETLIIVVSSYESGGLSINKGDVKTGKMQVKWSGQNPTASLTPVFAIGPGAEQFSGIYDNTEVFNKILSFIELR